MSRFLRRNGRLVRRDGRLVRVTAGDPCECCSGSVEICRCTSGSPWVATDCTGSPYLKFRAIFTPDTSPTPPFAPDYDEVVGYTQTCIIEPYGGTRPTLSIGTNATFSGDPFEMTPANSGQPSNCTFVSYYEIYNGSPPYDGHGLSDGGLERESSSTLQTPLSADAGDGWSSTVATLEWGFEISGGSIRVYAAWNATVVQNELQAGSTVGSITADDWWVARSEQWTLLEAYSDWMTPAEFCALTEVTCTSAGGGSCVITNDASIPPPVNGVPSAECYDVEWLDVAETDTGDPCAFSNATRTDSLVREFGPDGTPYWVGSESQLLLAPGKGWILRFTSDVGEVGEVDYNIPFADDGSQPYITGGVTYTGGAGVVSLTQATGCGGETSPCDSYVDCYQLGTDDTITITRPGRLLLLLNDSNYADNEDIQLEGDVTADGVYDGVAFIPNDSADGLYYRNVSAGEEIRFVQTGGSFNIGSDPAGRMDADGQYDVGGGSPGTTTAGESFACPGLLTYTLVAKVVAP